MKTKPQTTGPGPRPQGDPANHPNVPSKSSSNLPTPPRSANPPPSRLEGPELPGPNVPVPPRSFSGSRKKKTLDMRRAARRKVPCGELSKNVSSFPTGFLAFRERQKRAQALTMKLIEGETQNCVCNPRRKEKIRVAMGKLAYMNSKTFAGLFKKYSGYRIQIKRKL